MKIISKVRMPEYIAILSDSTAASIFIPASWNLNRSKIFNLTSAFGNSRESILPIRSLLSEVTMTTEAIPMASISLMNFLMIDTTRCFEFL